MKKILLASLALCLVSSTALAAGAGRSSRSARQPSAGRTAAAQPRPGRTVRPLRQAPVAQPIGSAPLSPGQLARAINQSREPFRDLHRYIQGRTGGGFF
jgi:hypothetical protein